MVKKGVKYQNNLELSLRCDREESAESYRASKTICQHQYTTYPLRLSTPFYLEGSNSNRIYHYLINTSPGLLAGDELNLSLHLAPDTNLYLTDQAATKVHPMPAGDTKAVVNYQITVDRNSSLELVPEPIILYADSILEQELAIKCHPTAKIFLSEIIIPGRIAKGEYYDFNYYFNRLQVTDLAGKLLLADATNLLGKNNQFKNDRLFTSLPIIGNAIAVLPDTDLELLTRQIEDVKLANCKNIEIASTNLPNNNGILIRALSSKTVELKKYFAHALSCIRAITNQSALPYIPK